MISTQKFAILCGILSGVVFFTCIILAAHFSSWFSWTENYISDFGGIPYNQGPIWYAGGTPSIIFNVGVALSGLLGIIFSIIIRKKTNIFS